MNAPRTRRPLAAGLLLTGLLLGSAGALVPPPAPAAPGADATEALPTVPGLSADYVDGRDSSSFADRDHDHDARYYTEAEAEARFLGLGAKAADSDRLDGLDGAQVLRSDASGTLAGSLGITGGLALGGASGARRLHLALGPGEAYAARIDAGDHQGAIEWFRDGAFVGTVGADFGDLTARAAPGRGARLAEADGRGVYVAPGGRVGVGTTAPVAALDVRGGLHLQQGDGGGFIVGNGRWSVHGFDQAQFEVNEDTDPIDTTVQRRLVIQGGTGRVGIGTMAPQARLDVAGDIAFDGQKVCAVYVDGTTGFATAPVLVPPGWTASTCQAFAQTIRPMGPAYRLGCIFRSGYAMADFGAAHPSPNCGW